MAYELALDEQRRVHADVLAGRCPPTVLLVEHDPVITISRRESARRHLLADDRTLQIRGIDVCQTDRGGDITYHGPGQIVAYPIVRLNDLKLNVRRYVRLLEQIVIDTVAFFGVQAARDPCAVGVWVDFCNPPNQKSEIPNQKSVKLAAIGVRVQRWVTLHGLALNVATNLDDFNLIVPCGLTGRRVTSLQQLLGDRCPSVEQVKQELIGVMRRHLSVSDRD